ncbi:hypothetical protein CEXT_248951 [Caerostris extrusa]|uniref:Uncharacterized protein n=1 Tax=Caerostris extrusa TaxID=172846 RepID=A0AAV4UR45_CAEEX|nr:hypothetical protein CEXT_248951 [Caerostris extrusa]
MLTFSLPDDVCNRKASEVCTSEYQNFGIILKLQKDTSIYAGITQISCRAPRNSLTMIVNNWSSIVGIANDEEFKEYCSLKQTNTIKLLKDHLGSEEMIPFHHVTGCLNEVLEVNCFADQYYKKCGSDLKDAANEILGEVKTFISRFKLFDNFCPKTLHPEFLTLLELIEKLTKEEIYFKIYFNEINVANMNAECP